MHNTATDKTYRLEVAEILARGMADYKNRHGQLPRGHWKVVNALQACRTAAMGGHSYRCDACAYEKHVYNSCRNRHCPKCQGMARLKWVQDRLEELLPVDYFHVVFTVPAELNPFALRNKKEFYNLLHKSVAETLLELARDPRRIGAEIGFISVLHTWGQNMIDHPHIHCIVPSGGLKNGKKWIKCRGKFLFPFKVMARLFKGKLLDTFNKAVASGDIRLLGNLKDYAEPSYWRAFLDGLYAKDWVAYCKPPFADARQVLKYLGGYTHRIAISNHRITNINEKSVTFKWRSYADNKRIKLITLSLTEFIRRFLLHVLPQGYKRIRYYGFMANCKRKKALERCFEILAAKKKASKKNGCNKNYVSTMGLLGLLKEIFGIDLALCPKCRGTLRPIFSGVRYSGGVF